MYAGDPLICLYSDKEKYHMCLDITQCPVIDFLFEYDILYIEYTINVNGRRK